MSDPQQQWQPLEQVSADRGELAAAGRERWWHEAERDGDAWCRRCKIHRVQVVGKTIPRLCPVCSDKKARKKEDGAA